MHNRLARVATTKIHYYSALGKKNESANKLSMELACMQENEARFSQAEDIPFMQDPLLTNVGHLAKGPATQDILHGAYTPNPKVDYFAQLFVAELKMLENIRCEPLTSDWVSLTD